jgi:hypothetical protein
LTAGNTVSLRVNGYPVVVNQLRQLPPPDYPFAASNTSSPHFGPWKDKESFLSRASRFKLGGDKPAYSWWKANRPSRATQESRRSHWLIAMRLPDSSLLLVSALDSPPAHKVQNKHHHGNDDEDVDKTACDVKGKAANPEQYEQNRDDEEHT